MLKIQFFEQIAQNILYSNPTLTKGLVYEKDFVLSKPKSVVGTIYEDSDKGDTMMKLSGVEGGAYPIDSGDVIFYNRLPLEEVLSWFGGSFNLKVDETALTTHDLIPFLEFYYDADWSTDDFIDEPITFVGDGTASITLKASPTSYKFTGELPMKLMLGSSKDTNVLATTLNGFDEGVDRIYGTKGYAEYHLFGYNFTLRSSLLINIEEGEMTLETFDVLSGIVKDIVGSVLLKYSETESAYNLYGSKITYNGLNDVDFKTNHLYKYVMFIELSRELCNNLQGSIIIHYNDGYNTELE